VKQFINSSKKGFKEAKKERNLTLYS